MIRAIPNINTARLSLRAMRSEDFDRYAEIWAMRDVVYHILPEPRDRRAAWESFLRNAGHWQMVGFGQWAVIEQKTRQMVGQAGFFYGSGVMGEDFDPFPEARWLLVPEAQGRGLGREAAMAAHDWFDRIVTGPAVARIAERNERSMALAEHLNYKPMRALAEARDRVVLFRRNGPRDPD